tara:strand:+ start:384 stop:689 length:306 start_codon:yes stop_codon:yes gene_type:complete
MGPILNAYLLWLQLNPFEYIGTRSMLFTLINLWKVPLRMYDGSLSIAMFPLAAKLSVVAVIGIFLAKSIVARIPKDRFIQLEYFVVAIVAIRLIQASVMNV